jgi:hypothetical protein
VIDLDSLPGAQSPRGVFDAATTHEHRTLSHEGLGRVSRGHEISPREPIAEARRVVVARDYEHWAHFEGLNLVSSRSIR